MTTLRVTVAQINTTVGDLAGNVHRARNAYDEAVSRGSDLVVFPELAVAGYPPEDLLLKPGFLVESRRALETFAESVGAAVAVIGFADCADPAHGRGPVYNAAAVIADGRVRCIYHKMFLPNYGVFDEKRYFAPGNEPVYFLLNGAGIEVSICEDIWIENGPHCAFCASRHLDVLLNLSSSPFHAGKYHEREAMLAARTRECRSAVVYANLVGGQDELVFDGGSMVFGADGAKIAGASLFREELLTCDIVVPAEPSVNGTGCEKITAPGHDLPELNSVESRDLSIDGEILEALVLGTRDYIRKNGFSKVVIGLSGGIDSALVAAVATRALGPDNVVTVTMPSKYTSTGTRSDAEALAANLGARFIELPIKSIYDVFETMLADMFKDVEPDVTEENIQARIRGILLMALSNKFGWLVLTTGNKSETATGYCTLYGDMAGGFAVIKDVPKTTVYRICRLINEQDGRETIPESIIVRPPSAELRPDQKDEDSLPPYDVLDPILAEYIERDLGVNDIAALGYDRDTVRRVISLVDHSEYKRRQAPPGIKITPRAFGRDRRLPITNRFRP